MKYLIAVLLMIKHDITPIYINLVTLSLNGNLNIPNTYPILIHYSFKWYNLSLESAVPGSFFRISFVDSKIC